MPLWAPNLHFSNEKSTFLMKNRYFFNGRSWRGLGVVWWRRGPARSAPMQRGARFFQKQCFPCSVALVLGRGWRQLPASSAPMQRGARSGPRGWRQLPARSAPMQRGARFLQKQCFPCSVALVLGRGGGASGRPGATPKHQRVRWQRLSRSIAWEKA